MKSPIVSVIMPVFNAESTLEKALKSFQCQTLDNWELIAINDGSTDGSLALLKSFELKDSRIVIIDKPNGGVSSARQAGLDRVKGKYVIHADSDDWVEPDMLRVFVETAQDTDADMVIADYFVDKSDGESKLIIQNPSSLKSKEVLYSIYAKKLHGGLCHKLLKTEVYTRASAKFIPNINFCEDQLLLTQILSRLDLKIVYLPQAFYHYVMTQNSLTRNFNRNGFEQMLRFNEVFPSLLPDEPRFKSFVRKNKLDTFVMGFINHAYKDDEIKNEFAKVKKDAYASYGIRWKTGFLLLELGMFDLARCLIKFK